MFHKQPTCKSLLLSTPQNPVLENLDQKQHPLLGGNITYNITWLSNQISNVTNQLLPISSPRIHSSIRLDKQMYLPNDVVFIEVLLFNSLNKTPVAIQPLNPKDPRYQYYNLSIEIKNSSDFRVYSKFVQANTSTVVLSFKLPSTLEDGSYLVMAYNSKVAMSTMNFTVQNLPKDRATISTQILQNSYQPGSTVTGLVTVKLLDKTLLNSNISLFYVVSFQNSSSLNTSIGLSQISKQGVITFTIINPELMVIDAYLSTGYLAFNIQNVVYFQAWQSSKRSQTFDFQNAELKQRFINNTEISLGLVSSQQFGRGQFTYVPVLNQTALIVEISNQGQLIRRNLYFNNTFNQNNNRAELSFKILNINRVLNNNENLQVQLMTNEKVNKSDDYLMQIKLKEQILYQEQITLNPSANQNFTVQGRLFPLINGGILSLSIQKLTVAFKNFYRNKSVSETVSSNVTISNMTTWFEPKGELIFFKRPNDRLTINITTDKTQYSPGDSVSYSIKVLNSTTGKVITTDSYLSLTAVDISGLQTKSKEMILPKSYQSRLYFSQEILNFENEKLFRQRDFDQAFLPNQNETISLDLLFGVQQWRIGLFNVQNLATLSSKLKNLSPYETQAIQGLYNYVFKAFYSETKGQYEHLSSTRSGDQGYFVNPLDYMQAVTNPRSWSHPLRANFTSALGIEDLTQTVLFQSVITVKNGVTSGKFYLNDNITNYFLTADAFNSNGVIGYNYLQIKTIENFQIKISGPEFMAIGDSVKIPINITNLNTAAIQVSVFQDLSKSQLDFKLSSLPMQSVLAGQTLRTFITATALQVNPNSTLTLIANATLGNRILMTNDSVQISIEDKTYDKQYQTRGSIIGSSARSIGPSNINLQISLTNDLIQNSSKYYISIYPTFISMLDDSIKSISQLKTGNFEQVASSFYPLALKLDFLKGLIIKTNNQQVIQFQIQKKLESQIEILLTQKIQIGQNLRFNGNDLSNEAITAFALQFFIDISTIISVDKTIINQLAGYLNSRRNGRGGFIQSFSNPLVQSVPEMTLNAYIVNALIYHNSSINLTTEINTLKTFADSQLKANKSDAYILTLIAQSLYRLKRTAEATIYADALTRLTQKDGRVVSNRTNSMSVFLSSGKQLDIETTALATQVWNNDLTKYSIYTVNAISYLASQIDKGIIGGSQGTYTGLKAFKNYFQNSGLPTINGNGSFTLKLNDLLIQTKQFQSGVQEAITFNISDYIINNSRIFAPGSTLNFNVGIDGFNLSSGQSKDFRAILSISHRYLANQSYVPAQPANLTSDFQVIMKNQKNLGLENQTGNMFPIQVQFQNIFPRGSTLSGEISLNLDVPSCLEFDKKTVKKLIDNGDINNLLIDPNSGRLILFIPTMVPGQVKSFQLNFMQRFSGQCQQRESMVQQSYGDFEMYAKTLSEL
ncbi:a-macroglobulin complement component [Stylonychia lemnae]|uniref:A-macroglobulin complement component n=1 Tax=Stylonychia lemnae TaxID=5949 RepID=A0A078A511_STYLE|nr:a-macroglobulin complement component [Stylonychia lemnae]|eukprot:CDW76949.1 a-macroglobulin complement component [Stylonychia lemnae]